MQPALRRDRAPDNPLFGQDLIGVWRYPERMHESCRLQAHHGLRNSLPERYIGRHGFWNRRTCAVAIGQCYTSIRNFACKNRPAIPRPAIVTLSDMRV